jgi:tetratricopeptide (TPR) repeat protein
VSGVPYPQPQPDAVTVRAALDRVLAGPAFRDSPQLKAFLAYVVDETLAGRGEEIKGYSIATLALGRPASFDPQTDPIVRVQAGRVRQALAEHYEANPGDAVLIRLEKGSYAPVFLGGPTDAPLSSSEAVALRPPIAPAARAAAPALRRVRRFGRRQLVLAAGAGAAVAAAAGGSWLALRPGQAIAPPSAIRADVFYPTLTVEPDQAGTYLDIAVTAARVRDAIARFDDLIVVADSPDMESTAGKNRLQRGAHLVLRINGDPAEAGAIRLSARLLDRADQRLIWSREFGPFAAGAAGDSARTAIIRSIASTIAQPYGVVHAYVRSTLDGAAASKDPYGCLVASFDYWQTNDRKTHGEARTCITERLKQQPMAKSLHAQLAYLHLEEFRHGFNPLPGDPLARALDSAQAAVRIAPTSARSHQALLAARFSWRDMDGAWKSANEALQLNPYDTDIIADVGARHIQSGRYEKGLAMLNEAFELNTAPPIWATTYQGLALYMLDRWEEASLAASRLETTTYPGAIVATVLVAYRERKAARGKERLALLRSTHPDIAANLESYLNRLNVDPNMLRKVMTSYANAVAWIDQQ